VKGQRRSKMIVGTAMIASRIRTVTRSHFPREGCRCGWGMWKVAGSATEGLINGGTMMSIPGERL